MKHLAIILDGNRTWAREQGKPEFLGHTQGAKNIQTIVKAVIKHNIEVLSMYVLSTENLKNRSEWEEQKRTCPGIDKGKLHTPDEIEKRLRPELGDL